MSHPHPGGDSAAPEPTVVTPPAKDGTEQIRAAVGNPLPSLLVALASYGSGLVAAVVVLVASFAANLVFDGAWSDTLFGTSGSDPMTSVSGSGPGLFQMILFYVGLPAQLVAAAFLGRYGVKGSGTLDAGFLGSYPVEGSAHVLLVPWLVLAAVLAVAFLGGRRIERRAPGAAPGQVWLQAGLGAAAVAILSTLGILIFALRVSEGLDGLSITVRTEAILPFLTMLLFISSSIVLGRLSVRPRPSWWPRVRELSDGVKLALAHAAVATLVGGILAIIGVSAASLSSGEDLGTVLASAAGWLLLVPLLIGQFFTQFFGLSVFSASGARATQILFSSDATYVSMFSAQWWIVIFAVLASLALIVLASLVWRQSRTHAPGDTLAAVTSWAALPVAYGAFAVVGLIVGGLGLSVTIPEELGYFLGLSDGRYAASVGLAWWTPVLAILAGLIIEVLSRYAAPFIGGVLPVNLGRFIHASAPVAAAASAAGASAAAVQAGGAGSAGAESASEDEAPSTAHAAEAGESPEGAGERAGGESTSAESSGSDSTGAQSTGSVPVGPPVAEPVPASAPLSPRAKKGLLVGGIAIGAAVLLAIAAGIGISVANGTVFSPTTKVEAYMSAIEDGRFGDAAELAPPNIANGNRVLLTNEVGAATTDRISSYTVDQTTVQGDWASVTVTSELDGVSQTQVFELARTGNSFLIFPEWTLQPPEYGYVSMPVSAAGTLSVNGVEVDASSATVPREGAYTSMGMMEDSVPLPAFPGTYTITREVSSEYLDVDEVTVAVSGSGPAHESGTWAPTLNAKGFERVNELVKAEIDACFKDHTESTFPLDSTCRSLNSSIYVYGRADGTPASWSVTSYPLVSLQETSDGWSLSTNQRGKTTYTYMQKRFGTEEPTEEREEGTLSVSGDVTVNDEGDLEVVLDRY
ncbi:MAG: hypothetical protein Q4G21_09885 [Dermabacter sp.]|nr:hypothetical protein [Dermabacter sp.]